MNKFFLAAGRIAGMGVLCLTVAACADKPDEHGSRYLRLAPCTASGSLFGDVKPATWPKLYHQSVSQVIEAHLGRVNKVSQLPLKCTAGDYASMEQPTGALQRVASGLPAWQGQMQDLSEADMGAVLLELLRVYECSLNERRQYLPVLVPQEFTGGSLERGKSHEMFVEQEDVITRELRMARPALERTLELVGGYDRLRPLALDIECLKRASLDLRNVLGLAAEASACLPRSWDVRGSLNDLPD